MVQNSHFYTILKPNFFIKSKINERKTANNEYWCIFFGPRMSKIADKKSSNNEDCLYLKTKTRLGSISSTNALHTAFALVNPKSVKRYWQLNWVFMLWGATGVKAAPKYVDEIDPWSNWNWKKCQRSFTYFGSNWPMSELSWEIVREEEKTMKSGLPKI